MANAMYPKGKEGLLTAQFNMSSDTIKVALLNTDVAAYDAGHDFYNDISAGVVGTPVALTSKTYAGGVFDSADPTWTGVSGAEFEAMVIYKDTGDPATSPLLLYVDTGVTGLPMTPVSGNITYTVPADGWFGL